MNIKSNAKSVASFRQILSATMNDVIKIIRIIYVLFKNAGNSNQRTASWWPDAPKCKNLAITKVPYMTLVYVYGNINWYGCWRWQVINHLCASCYTNRTIHSTSPCPIDQQQVRLSQHTSMSSWWVHLRPIQWSCTWSAYFHYSLVIMWGRCVSIKNENGCNPLML